MEHDYLALLSIGSGPSKLIFTDETNCIPKQCFSDFSDLVATNPDALSCNNYI